jgi:hypothetical protein
MNRATLAGLGLSLVGFAGYVAGVSVAYPGRGFSITALMSGIALAIIFREPAGDDE